VGVDVSERQLATARELQAERSVQFPLMLEGLHSITWPDDGSTEFNLPHGERLRVLRDAGFEVEVLHELQVPEDAGPTRYTWITMDWARRWPCEEIWLARKRDPAVDNRPA
jgi:hypothetical protein